MKFLDLSTVFGVLLISICVTVIILYVVYKVTPKRNRPKPFEVVAFASGLLINIPLFFISIYSLFIAKQTYLDSKADAPLQQAAKAKQQAALDGSRRALEAVINVLNNQTEAIEETSNNSNSMVKNSLELQKIQKKGLQISSLQLQFIKEQQRLVSLKPKLAILVNEIMEDKLVKQGVVFTSSNETSAEYSNYDTFTINLKVKNVGDAIAHSPYAVFSTVQNVLFRNGDESQYINTSGAIFRKYLGSDLPIFQDYAIYMQEYIKFSVPKGMNQFMIGIKVCCYNVPAHIIMIPCRIEAKN